MTAAEAKSGECRPPARVIVRWYRGTALIFASGRPELWVSRRRHENDDDYRGRVESARRRYGRRLARRREGAVKP